MRVLGPLPLIETEEVVLIPFLPGELIFMDFRTGQVGRDSSGIRIDIADAVLLFDLRAERALRAARQILLVEAQGGQARGLGPLTLIWDI